MGLLKDLWAVKIRFNPRPWSNPGHIVTNVPKVEEKSFVDLHLEVAQKVDALIAQLDQEKSLEDTVALPNKQEWDLTPEKTMANIEDLLQD
jgi:hypothetical protein